MDGVTIRYGKAEDASAIAAVIRDSFEELRGMLLHPSSAHDETSATVLKKLRTAIAFLCIVGEEPAGCVFCEPQGEDVYVFRLAVRPKFRGSGLGRMLTERAEQFARDGDFMRVRLGTSYPPNVAFYEALGYDNLGERPHPEHGTEGFVVLVKVLR